MLRYTHVHPPAPCAGIAVTLELWIAVTPELGLHRATIEPHLEADSDSGIADCRDSGIADCKSPATKQDSGTRD